MDVAAPAAGRSLCIVSQRKGEEALRTVVGALWSPPDEPHAVSLWLTFPGATRSEQQSVLAGILAAAVDAAAAAGQRSLAVLPLESQYSRDKFEHNLELVTDHLADYLLLAPRSFSGVLELLTVQLDAYLGETFGAGAEEAFLEDMRGFAAAGNGSPRLGSRASRVVATYARLLHLRAVLLTETQWEKLPEAIRATMPPALGDRLSHGARPWLDALAELLLAHWVGSSEALSLALRTAEFRRCLAELGWHFPKQPGAQQPPPLEAIQARLAAAAARQFGSSTARTASLADWPFWSPEELLKRVETKSQRGKSHEEFELRRLQVVFSRWLVLHRLLDLELLEITRETFQKPSRLAVILEVLWPETRELAFRWLLLHKQWSTPEGVNREEGEKARHNLLKALKKPQRSNHPLDSVARLESDAPLTLHVDPLWTNLYLVHRLLRHLGPGVAPEEKGARPARWEALRREVPTPAGQRELLRHLARAIVFLLWQLIQHERYPERYTIVPPRSRPPTGSEEDAQADAGDLAAALPPWLQQPVGAEAYAQSLIHLMDVFGHSVLHVEREVEIARYLNRVIESELLLHAVSDYYRDHLYHLVDLAMLGDFLLTARGGRRSGYLWRLLAPSPDGGRSRGRYRLDVLRKQFFIAAVFHDVGYLFSLIARVPEMIREQGSRSHEQFLVSIEHAFQGEIESLESSITDLTRHLAERRVGLDRGVHSAVILRDHLREAVRPAEREGGLLDVYAPSLRAICQHSLHREKVSQDEDPLSFLMVLCDELTDWGRTRVRAQELRRFTVFRTELVANWQERRIPVLTELLFPVAGLEGGAFVINAPAGGIGRGAQPYTRRRVHRLDIVQVYQQDEEGYLNPVYLWVSRARNLERLVPSQRGTRRLAIRIFTLTGVPYRLRKAETVHTAVLEEIAVRHPDLRLGDLVRTLEQEFDRALYLDRELQASAPAAGQAVKRVGGEIGAVRSAGERRPRAGDRTVELQVFSIESLCRAQPLRGFERERSLNPLAEAYQRVLAEREEQRRLRGLRALRSGELGGP